MKKYELGESEVFYGKTLFRVVALIAFGDISVGDIGGWVESENNLAQVSGNAWVYGDAQVYGNAWVYGNAQVYGDARVYGDAQVYGNAWVYGDARVYGKAQVSGNAWVYGDAQVYGNAWVYGNAQVSGNAWVYGDAQVSGNAWVYGDARVYGKARVSGDARVYGKARVSGDAQVSKTVNCLQSGRYFISISDNYIQIGCQHHPITEWKNFNDETISEMDNGALEWWKIWKPIIFAIIEAYPNKSEEKK